MDNQVASIIMAAGRGSRMKGYEGNKTLLPLEPEESVFSGRTPILVHLMQHLPTGPKALVVNHCEEQVKEATRETGVSYCRQPILNGTGGAILAAEGFLAEQTAPWILITMGDVPFVRQSTYDELVGGLKWHDLMILGFCPQDKKKYGVLEIEAGRVKKITEWKFWRTYPSERQALLTVCNSGIYAVRRAELRRYLPIMASRPQIVQKEIDGRLTRIEEFFFTDLIEHMVQDRKRVGYCVVEEESETMGIDDVDALKNAQNRFAAVQISG